MKRSAQQAIRELLVRRAPNWVSEVTVHERLREFRTGDLTTALQQLVDAGTIQQGVDLQAEIALPRRYFKLPNYQAVPIRETISVGGIEVPRILSSAAVTYAPESINEAVERLAEHSDALEGRFMELVRDQHDRYWANVVGLFGIFASVIALVVATLPNLKLQHGAPFWYNVAANLSILLPVAVVLGLLVVFARWVVR